MAGRPRGSAILARNLGAARGMSKGAPRYISVPILTVQSHPHNGRHYEGDRPGQYGYRRSSCVENPLKHQDRYQQDNQLSDPRSARLHGMLILAWPRLLCRTVVARREDDVLTIRALAPARRPRRPPAPDASEIRTLRAGGCVEGIRASPHGRTPARHDAKGPRERSAVRHPQALGRRHQAPFDVSTRAS